MKAHIRFIREYSKYGFKNWDVAYNNRTVSYTLCNKGDKLTLPESALAYMKRAEIEGTIRVNSDYFNGLEKIYEV